MIQTSVRGSCQGRPHRRDDGGHRSAAGPRRQGRLGYACAVLLVWFAVLLAVFFAGVGAAAAGPAAAGTAPAGPVAAAAASVAPTASQVVLPVPWLLAPSAEALEMVRLVNEAREENGLPPLQLDMRLFASAQAKADQMRDEGYFGHVSPAGETPFQLMARAGVHYAWAGENLAGNPFGVAAAEEALWNSPSHRENILNPHFRYVGIGISYGGPYGAYYVQHFASLQPGDQAVALEPSRPWQLYTVQPGDTLFKLAQQSGSSVSELAGWNHLASPDWLDVGQVLKVPVPGRYRQIEVQPGDTLYALSLAYASSIAQLVAINHISQPDQLDPGEALWVPAA